MDDVLLKQHILLRLIYGEVFRHPMRMEELEQLMPGTPDEISIALKELKSAGLILEKDGYYFIFEEKNKISYRKAGNEKAGELLPKAWKVGRKIYRFPYITGVGISGSLSKGVLHEDGDFDFFIVTKPNRLWVARTLLILYKKIFLFNSRRYFCVNYFVDTEHLEIEEKNAFTATEIATLMPVAGDAMLHFFEQNQWIEEHFRMSSKAPHYTDVPKPWLSRTIMWMLNGRFGEWVDRTCMRLTLRRWKRKFGEYDEGTFELTMKTRKYISKHHPNNFQDRVLGRLEELRQQYIHLHGDQLVNEGIEL